MKSTHLILPCFVICVLAACQGNHDSTLTLPPVVATLAHPAQSPSGLYHLVITTTDQKDIKMLSFQVQDLQGKPIFVSPDLFSTRDKTCFLWDAQDRIWVATGQQAPFFWQKENEQWIKHDPTQSNIPMPAFLKQAIPVQH